MKLTKTAMLDFIESTGVVIDFDRKYLMRRDKEYIERLYQHAVAYSQK